MTEQELWSIEGFIDRPTPRMMGPHGLLIHSGDKYEITAVAGLDQPITKRDSKVIIGDNIVSLSGINAPEHLAEVRRSNWAALYMGDVFHSDAINYGVDIEVDSMDSEPIKVHEGRLWLGDYKNAYGYFDSWQQNAFQVAIASDRKEIANFMARTNANDLRTYAAQWHTAKSEEEKDAILDWQQRIEVAGQPKITREELIEKLSSLVLEASV